MYQLSPFRPVSEIVNELLAMEPHETRTILSRCAAHAVADENPQDLLRLALAYYVVSGTRLDGDVMAEMVEVMRTQGVSRLFNGATSHLNS